MFNENKVGNEQEQRKRIESLWWAGVLIWAGLIFAADSLGILPQVGEADAWSWVFLGAGLLATPGNFYRASSVDTPNPTTWDWVWGGIFLILGLGGFMVLYISWPLILILVGGVTLVRALGGREKTPVSF